MMGRTIIAKLETFNDKNKSKKTNIRIAETLHFSSSRVWKRKLDHEEQG